MRGVQTTQALREKQASVFEGIFTLGVSKDCFSGETFASESYSLQNF